MSDPNYVKTLEDIVVKQSKRIAELEDFLTTARIPDAQEWLRKKLKEQDND